MTPQNRNKQNAIAFYQLMFNDCQPAEALARYVGDEYVQHNPLVADGSRASSPISWLCRPSIRASTCAWCGP